MGSFLRITLLSLFAASGAGAAICVALIALPAKHKPDAAAVRATPRSETANDMLNEIRYPGSVLPEPVSPPNLFAVRGPAGDSTSRLWSSDHLSPAADKSVPPAPIASVARTVAPALIAPPPPFATIPAGPSRNSPAASRPKFENMLRPSRQSDVILTSATEPTSAAEPPATARLAAPNDPPRLLRAPAAQGPIASVVKSPATFVVAAQASELPPATTDSTKSNPPEPIPPPVQQAPAPNSPQAKQQVSEGMDELRKLLETTSRDAGAETVAKPVAVDKTPDSAVKPNSAGNNAPRTKAKITKVGEGDEHFALDIQDADIRDVLEMISRQGQINILPSNSVKGKVTASLHDVDMEAALAAILKSTGYVTRKHGKFVYVGTSQDFQNLEQSLDKIGTRIYRTNYVRASDMQALITPLLTQGIGAISVTSASEVGIGTDSTKAGGNSFAGGEAVLVRDYEAVLAQIDQVVGEIDKRPLQVAIEAMILSVKLDDSDQFGVNFALLRQNPHIALASGSPPSSIGDVNFNNGGLTFGFLDTTLGAFLSAVETVGDTHVIATPRVVCLDKQRAEILIGSQLGYISSTVTETSTAQNVNFLEVGTQLRIRPFISSDGLVRMEVHPELSTGQVTTQGGFTLPDKDLTQVTTNVMVRDGATVVIGGLIREDLTTNTTQIPLLGNLPGVGFLFRQKQETTQRTEILVLITPHIVYDCEASTEGARGATEFHRREAVYADQMSPLGKRHLGRKYYRLAQEAFAAGDQPRALRFIDLAIHFDPLNRAAIDLRTDIVAGNHFGEHTEVKFPTVANAADAGAPEPDGQNIPPWMLNELDHRPQEGQFLPPPVPVHPLDPGQPGSSTNIDRPRQLE